MCYYTETQTYGVVHLTGYAITGGSAKKTSLQWQIIANNQNLVDHSVLYSLRGGHSQIVTLISSN